MLFSIQVPPRHPPRPAVVLEVSFKDTLRSVVPTGSKWVVAQSNGYGLEIGAHGEVVRRFRELPEEQIVGLTARGEPVFESEEVPANVRVGADEKYKTLPKSLGVDFIFGVASGLVLAHVPSGLALCDLDSHGANPRIARIPADASINGWVSYDPRLHLLAAIVFLYGDRLCTWTGAFRFRP